MSRRPVIYNPGPMNRLFPLLAALLLCSTPVHAARPLSPVTVTVTVTSDPVLIVAAREEADLAPMQFPTAMQSPASGAVPPPAEEPATMQEVVLHALALLGTPYRWGGNGPGGFDCSGLVNHVVQQALGLTLPRSAAAMSRIGAAIERQALRAGDLLFFITARQDVSHVGIYVGEDRFVHATRSGGDVRMSALSERYWSARYVGARRIAGP